MADAVECGVQVRLSGTDVCGMPAVPPFPPQHVLAPLALRCKGGSILLLGEWCGRAAAYVAARPHGTLPSPPLHPGKAGNAFLVQYNRELVLFLLL